MSLWKRLAGAASGLAADAHLTGDGSIGNLLKAAGQRYVFGRQNYDDMAEHQVAFTVGVIALGAKMAKADGIVTRDEVLAFKEVFKVPDGEMENVSRIFNLAKQDTFGYESYASQLASLLKDNHRLLEDVLEGLFHIAKADQTLHPQEERFLRNVAKRFGLTDTEFNHIKARYVVATERNPYDVLGVNPSVSNDELKSHYRKLIADNNPDKLLGRGVPKEFVTIANKRVAAIDAAYDAILKQRSG